ncbi:MAG: hypothetical protein ABSC56_03720 [Solirubrobacteraceae bacterium]
MKLAARVKPAYGPSLDELARARMVRVPRGARTLSALAVALVVVLAALVTLRGGSSSISGRAGGVQFSFSYSGLVRELPPRGDSLLLARYKGHRLVAEIALAPLRLPAYHGAATGIEPLVAANYMRAFAARTPGIVLQNTGPTVLGATAGYNYTYTRTIDASSYFGRVIFLTPSLYGARDGVVVSLLAQPVLSGIIGPGRSNLAGALYEPGQGGVGVLFQPAGLLSEPLATLRIAAG